MREDMDLDWDTLFETCPDDPDAQYEILTTHLKATADRHIPIKKHGSNGKPRISRELRAAIRRKNRAWTRLMESRTTARKQEYNRARNKVRNLSRRQKRQRELEIAQSAKACPKKFWDYARSKLKTRTGVGELQNPDDGNVAKTDHEKAEILSTFFASVFTSEPDGEIPQPAARVIDSPFEEHEITTDEVRKKLRALDP